MTDQKRARAERVVYRAIAEAITADRTADGASKAAANRIDAIYSEGGEPGDCFVDIAASVGGPTNVRCETHDKELTVPPSESRLRKALEEIRDGGMLATDPFCEWCGEEILHDEDCPVTIARRALSATPEESK